MEYVENDVLGGGFGLPRFAVGSTNSYMGFYDNADTRFTSFSQLKDIVDRMDKVTTVPLYRVNDNGDIMNSGRKAVVSTRYGHDNMPLSDHQSKNFQTFGKMYDAVSDRYICVQDGHVFGQMCDALSDSGFDDVCGYVRGLGSGRTRVDAYLIDDDAKFTLGNHNIEGRDDSGFFGISAWNGHNGKSSVGMSVSAIRQVCTNGMMGIKALGKVFSRHATGVMDFTDTFERRFSIALKNKDNIEEVVTKALARKLPIETYETILWGLGFGKRHMENMVNPEILAPEIKGIGLNAMTIYNAVTAYLSHYDDGDKYSKTTENRFVAAGDIINSADSLSRLIRMGEEAKKRAEEKKAKVIAPQTMSNVAYL